MTKHVDSPAGTLDDARRELCQRLATAIREGSSGIQVHLVQADQDIKEIWVYVHREHEWRKRNDLALPSHLGELLEELLENLTSRDYADTWSCRRTDHSDRTDFELKFNRDSVAAQLEGDLAAYLNGCLFHGHHDSGKDARRRIRFRENA